jgi:AcrR family transcriptional regulator
MEVKERILGKAADLFMRYGIRSITMDEIAGQLGISKKTIYQFFTDKDEMVESVITQEIEQNEGECLQFRDAAENAVHEIFIAQESMQVMLQTMSPLILYDLEKHHSQTFKKFKEYKYQFLYTMLKENLQRGVSEELYRPEINMDIVAKQRIESAFMVFNQDIFPLNRYKISELSDDLALLYLHGVTTAKGKKLIEKYSTERNKKLSDEQKN